MELARQQAWFGSRQDVGQLPGIRRGELGLGHLPRIALVAIQLLVRADDRTVVPHHGLVGKWSRAVELDGHLHSQIERLCPEVCVIDASEIEANTHRPVEIRVPAFAILASER